jgi:hypothetical protein
MVRPSALTVLRLTTSSNLVGSVSLTRGGAAVVGPYRGAAILPTTWTPGSIPGVGLRTTISAWSGMTSISGWMVKPWVARASVPGRATW